MSDFDDLWNNNELWMYRSVRDACEYAYNAGQATAEQRVKELKQRQKDAYLLELDMRGKIIDLEKERDDAKAFGASWQSRADVWRTELTALKAQAGVPDIELYVSECGTIVGAGSKTFNLKRGWNKLYLHPAAPKEQE